jgi:hypothetical protein
MMMGVITTDTKIGILNLAILLGHIILTQFTNNLLLQLLILGILDPEMDYVRR